MTALSPQTDFEQSGASKKQRKGRRAGVNTRRGVLRREIFEHWLGPILVAALLAAVHILGLFAHLDGRFFDIASVNRDGNPPEVVIVARDPQFDGGDPARFDALNGSLASLGIERVGYLGADYAGTGQSKVPVVLGLPVKALPTNRLWELEGEEAVSGAAATARSLAPAQYGINRSQTPALPGLSKSIPVFDAALAGRFPSRGEFLVPMPERQSIPILKANQITGGQIGAGELDGMVAMVVEPDALRGTISTSISPDRQATSEAIFRAHSINALRGGTYAFYANQWEVLLLMLGFGFVMATLYRQSDPKRLAILIPACFNILTLAACWAVLLFGGTLLPVSALLLAPWIITFQRMIARETMQDRRLERSASRAVQTSFNRSALREGARLPQFLASAAEYAGVERSLLIELTASGKIGLVTANKAGIEDIAMPDRQLVAFLKEVREGFAVKDASRIVPGWEGEARIGWVGAGGQDLFWIHTKPVSATPGKSAHLVRAIATSFREVFRWRADLNARDSHEARNQPIDNKVASAIALVANESGQIRHGFDAINTAVIIFHLIGSPLHANEAMKEIYDEAGLNLFDTSLSEVLLALTDLDEARVKAMIEDLMLNGSEMRMPMRNLNDAAKQGERMLRIAAPGGHAHGGDRVLVLEAIDMRDANRAADLRRAVAKFIDLQLRNDLEAIMLGSKLAGDTRLDREKIATVVGRIAETAERATGRLDEVAGIVRSETNDLTEACYPIDGTAVVKDAIARASGLAEELGVTIAADHPDITCFVIAEPVALTDMLVAMLRVVIADTPHGGEVKLAIDERDGRAHIRISGGFGIAFDRLLWLISNYEEGAVGEYRAIGEGMAKVTSWSASVSYWGSGANGLGFNIDLRGVG